MDVKTETAGGTVMDRLREGTADLHRGAEGSGFQQRMVAGTLSREDYARWLVQMLHVHRALEAPLRTHLGEPDFVAVREEQLQEPYLLEDLAALGVEPDAWPPLPAVAAFVADAAARAQESPLDLLGWHYVLEGSNNGNRFIARRLLPALGLVAGGGRYLDPYGAEQPVKWAAFKQAMVDREFSAEQSDVLLAAARRMFAVVGELSGQLG